MRYSKAYFVSVTGLTFLLSGCISDFDSVGGSSSSSSSPSQSEQVTAQGLGLPIVSDDEWDDTAVRKVLHTFAYGGHATDAQIATWADMSPDRAIVEILTFEEHNPLLSPVTAANADQLDARDGTLRGLGEFWSSDDPDNGTPEEDRWKYDIATDVDKIWIRAAASRGLNPFRQKIGLWESNYHMAVNLDATVFQKQVAGYYDDIVGVLQANSAYQDVLTVAATSAAVATQYGHLHNNYRNGVCYCNEDFAREYYQLFFGVLGDYDPDYHETVTIKNTAKAMTDMSVARDEAGLPTDSISFGTETHYPGTLEMLGSQYWGANMPERLDLLSQDVIYHPESLQNLPVMIISGLADDNLNEDKKTQIRNAWAGMEPKNLLAFLRTYAVSTLFHNEDRVKYLTSVDRYVVMHNKAKLSNEAVDLSLDELNQYKNEGVLVFHPTHNVFGSQTGVEASNSANVFHINYSRSTLLGHQNREAGGNGRSWEKSWGGVVPKDHNGEHVVREVAEWLWNRFIADGLKHFGPLERAHVYALLASNQDLIYLMDPDDLDRTITAVEVETDPAVAALVNNLSTQTLSLDSMDEDERLYANERVGQAINFIVATPYIFAQEGR